MSTNLKKRIYTSIALFLLLFAMLMNNYIFGYFLVVASVLSILEFSKMIVIILKNKKIKQFFFNLIFIIL